RGVVGVFRTKRFASALDAAAEQDDVAVLLAIAPDAQAIPLHDLPEGDRGAALDPGRLRLLSDREPCSLECHLSIFFIESPQLVNRRLPPHRLHQTQAILGRRDAIAACGRRCDVEILLPIFTVGLVLLHDGEAWNALLYSRLARVLRRGKDREGRE